MVHISATHAARAASMLLLLSDLGPAFAAHPLITEDTGTQGAGKFQLEHNNEWGYKDNLATKDTVRTTSTALSYGFTDNADVIINIPYVRSKTSGDGIIDSANGHSDNGIDVKWRFHQNHDWSYAIKAGATAPTGDETKGLGTGKATYSMYFVATLERSAWAINWHVGGIANRNTVGARDDIWHASMGGWVQLRDKVKLVGDTGILTNTDPAASRDPAWIILGIIYSPTDNFDFDVGAKRGLTRAEVDKALLVGLTFRF